ncbi:13257_t:CDS:2, partial [Rhizophagus irregularis]
FVWPYQHNKQEYYSFYSNEIIINHSSNDTTEMDNFGLVPMDEASRYEPMGEASEDGPMDELSEYELVNEASEDGPIDEVSEH